MSRPRWLQEKIRLREQLRVPPTEPSLRELRAVNQERLRREAAERERRQPGQ